VSTIDARGHRCPYPLVLLARAAAAAPEGSDLVLLSDDPVSRTDVPAWCRMRGAELRDVVVHAEYWEFRVRTAPEAPR
jgi:tRNA 2-thiouridine synthesizing protein A